MILQLRYIDDLFVFANLDGKPNNEIMETSMQNEVSARYCLVPLFSYDGFGASKFLYFTYNGRNPMFIRMRLFDRKCIKY